MEKQFFITVSSKLNSKIQSTIDLSNKTSVKEIEQELAEDGIIAKRGEVGTYFIEDYYLKGCPLEIDQSLEAIFNIVQLVKKKKSSMIGFLKKLFDYFGQQYCGELDFDYEDESDLDEFIEKHDHYYIGLYPDCDDVAKWFDEFWFPKIYEVRNDFPNLLEFVDWEYVTRSLETNSEIWVSDAPKDEYVTMNDEAKTIATQHVFWTIGRYHSDWNIPYIQTNQPH